MKNLVALVLFLLFPFSSLLASEGIEEKLRSITLPEVDFQKTALEDALDVLRQKSRELDTESPPEEQGLSFIVRSHGEGETKPTITLKLSNVPLVVALQYIAELAGMEFQVESNAIVFAPKGSEAFTRVWKVEAKNLFGGAGRGAPAAENSDLANPSPNFNTVQELLESVGITFPPGASAIYSPDSYSLIVRNTQDNLDLVEAYVVAIRDELAREIDVRMELYQVPLPLAVDLLDHPKTSGDESEMVERLRGKAESESVELISTASVVCRSGQRSRVSSGQSYRYLSGYDHREGKDIPKFLTANASTTLETDVVIGADGVTMDLNLSVEHSLDPLEIRKQEIVSPHSGEQLPYESILQNRASIVTSTTLLSGQTRFIGAMNGKEEGTTLAAFITAKIKLVSR
ncbi:MAG: hypothetical protein AAF191_16235 [Verrucomicrobiota bacterium]